VSPPITRQERRLNSIDVDPKTPVAVEEKAAPAAVKLLKEHHRTRHSTASSDESYTPSTRNTKKKKVVLEKKKRNKSVDTPISPKAISSPPTVRAASPATVVNAAANIASSLATSVQYDAVDKKPMSREEKKLQSVLRIIEKMESTKKKREVKQKEKKDGKPEEKEEEEKPARVASTFRSGPAKNAVKFAINKRRGKKRGRGGQMSPTKSPLKKPKIIVQKNTGVVDKRSGSTESELNSADETSRFDMSPFNEFGNNFRAPRTKKVCTVCFLFL